MTHNMASLASHYEKLSRCCHSSLQRKLSSYNCFSISAAILTCNNAVSNSCIWPCRAYGTTNSSSYYSTNDASFQQQSHHHNRRANLRDKNHPTSNNIDSRKDAENFLNASSSSNDQDVISDIPRNHPLLHGDPQNFKSLSLKLQKRVLHDILLQWHNMYPDAHIIASLSSLFGVTTEELRVTLHSVRDSIRMRQNANQEQFSDGEVSHFIHNLLTTARDHNGLGMDSPDAASLSSNQLYAFVAEKTGISLKKARIMTLRIKKKLSRKAINQKHRSIVLNALQEHSYTFDSAMVDALETKTGLFRTQIRYLIHSVIHKYEIARMTTHQKTLARDLFRKYISASPPHATRLQVADRKELVRELVRQGDMTFRQAQHLLWSMEHNLERASITNSHRQIVQTFFSSRTKMTEECYQTLVNQTGLSRRQVRDLINRFQLRKYKNPSKESWKTVYQIYHDFMNGDAAKGHPNAAERDVVTRKKMYDTMQQDTGLERTMLRKMVRYIRIAQQNALTRVPLTSERQKIIHYDFSLFSPRWASMNKEEKAEFYSQTSKKTGLSRAQLQKEVHRIRHSMEGAEHLSSMQEDSIITVIISHFNRMQLDEGSAVSSSQFYDQLEKDYHISRQQIYSLVARAKRQMEEGNVSEEQWANVDAVIREQLVQNSDSDALPQSIETGTLYETLSEKVKLPKSLLYGRVRKIRATLRRRPISPEDRRIVRDYLSTMEEQYPHQTNQQQRRTLYDTLEKKTGLPRSQLYGLVRQYARRK